MEAAARLSALHTAPPLLGELGLLADPTRGRMLACLDGVEMTVAELCDVARAAAVHRLPPPQAARRRGLGRCAPRRHEPRLRAHRSTSSTSARAGSGSSCTRASPSRSPSASTCAGASRCWSAAATATPQAFFSDVADEWDRAARRALRRDERPAAPARAARPRRRRRRPRLRLRPHRRGARARSRARVVGRRLVARDARRRARAPGAASTTCASSRAASRSCRSRPSRSTSRSSSISCTTWPIRRSRSPRPRACCGPAAGS